MADGLSLTRLRAIARKEWIQLRRDPRSLAMAFALPSLLLVLFGYAISWDIRNIKTIVIDRDHSEVSRALIDSFRSSGYFTIVGRLDRESEISDWMDRGAAQIAIVIPAEFQNHLESGSGATVQAIVDGSDANTATIAEGYTEAVVHSWSQRARLRATPVRLPVTAESRVWFNEELTSRNMIVPGLVAVIMMIIAAMLTSLTIAREWERGTMEQLAATPVARIEVVAGKLVPYILIGLADIVLCAGLGIALFGVPLRGDPILLMILSFFYLLGALGLGVFISAVAKSQLLATQLAMVLTFLPGFLLSGFMFAIEVMPRPLQLVTYLIPARYFLVVTRGIFLKGVGIEVLRIEGILMIIFAVVGLALAAATFRKEIE